VIDNLDATNDVTLVSRPTTKHLRDYKGSNLMKCFPLQFPYGVRNKPDSSKKKKKKSGGKSLYSDDQICYLQHLLSLYLLNMHQAESVVILHNIYECHCAVCVSYLCCQDQFCGTSCAESFADIHPEQLWSAINCSNAGMAVSD